ncbi:MAG: dipeptidase PepV [Planifilum fimeticola]
MMSIDWEREMEKRREELLERTKEFLAIESVLDESTAGSGAPFGKGVAEALEYLLDLARRDGFVTKNLDGYAGHVEYGEGEELIGILGHVDVVPPGDGWTTPPFSPDIRDGKLYARGAIDDKGPTMAAYFALRLIKELGLPLSKRVRLILGTDEENLWRDMAYYFEREEMPTMGFAPDADFPIIYAEKGLLDITLVGDASDAEEEADEEVWTLARWEAGHRFNMVPDRSRAVLEGSGDVFSLKEKYQDFLLKNRIRGYAQEADDHLLLVLEGRSHHGSEPDKGLNAGLEMARFLNTITLDPEGSRFIRMIHDVLVDDFFGKRLGIAQEDDTVGPLTVNAGVFRYRRGGERKLGLNVRYPIRGNGEDIVKAVAERVRPYGLKIGGTDHKPPHHIDPNHSLVRTLSRVYEERTGEKASLLAIGGGTYARALKNGVAFGPLFPGKEETAHQTDEHIEVEDLLKAAAIYAQAIYELAR